MSKKRVLQKIFNKNKRCDILTKRTDIKDYQKPEIVLIDNPAFEEMGLGDSGLGNPGTVFGDRGNGNGGDNAGGVNPGGVGGFTPGSGGNSGQ